MADRGRPGPADPLRVVRAGGSTDAAALLGAVGLAGAEPPARHRRDDVLGAALARVDDLGRTGAARLGAALAAVLHPARRAELGARLAGPLGMPLARRVADLVGLHRALRRPFPDAERRAGLLWLAEAADLGVLHAVAAAALVGEDGDAAERARAEVARSARWAEGAGLLDPDPLGPLRTGLRGALAGLPDDAADRGWAAARAAHAGGRPTAEVRGAALDPRWRAGRFPRLVLTSGPSGSGKSTAVAGWPGVDETVSMDDLRAARGGRADQRGNADVLRTGLAHLEAALRPGRTVVWDATSLDRAQREVVRAVGHRRGALVTTAVLLVPPDVVVARNDARPHRVPAAVLRDQLHRFGPPYPGETHRTWYLGEAGTVDDVAGSVRDAPP